MSAVGRYAELCIATHCCPWPDSQPTTGLLWKLTFDHAAEKASDGNSGRSRMATIDRHRIRAERLPKATNWRCRPSAAVRPSKCQPQSRHRGPCPDRHRWQSRGSNPDFGPAHYCGEQHYRAADDRLQHCLLRLIGRLRYLDEDKIAVGAVQRKAICFSVALSELVPEKWMPRSLLVWLCGGCMKTGFDRKYTAEFRDSAVKQVVEGGRGMAAVARSLDTERRHSSLGYIASAEFERRWRAESQPRTKAPGQLEAPRYPSTAGTGSSQAPEPAVRG